ncbi:MAG: CBS domain-containing protein [Gammaproteobacteria bacterium]|nr:CBS domain-containing protein [Gammaproteobacteria bacterium]NNF59726.1 CBS domain-containing protein [Gammaproteobacteria bacterium]
MNATRLTAQDFMITSIVTFSPDTEMMDALHELVSKEISGAPVLDERGNLVGLLTERDCLGTVLTAGYHGEAAGRVAEYMSRDVVSVDADASLMDIAERFSQTPYRRFPVMKNSRLVGLISRRDVLRAVMSLAG